MIKILKSYYRKLINIFKFYRRVNLKYKDVSIISNNCTAGYVYQFFGLPYFSPTVGLFFTTEDYLEFIENLEEYISKDIEFINASESKSEFIRNNRNSINYPIGKIGDIEIYFMHYHSQEEAHSKWLNRIKRIDLNKTIFLLTENEFTEEMHIDKFSKMKFRKKICLTYNKYNYDNTYYSERVSQMENKSWLPEIVLDLVDWRSIINDNKD